MPSIYDNQSPEKKLSSGLQKFFPSYQRIDVATGYFALRGWQSLDSLVRESFESGDVDRPVARILVGMVLPAQHEEIIDQLQSEISPNEDETQSLRERAPQVREALKAHLRAQLATGIPTAKDRETLQSLRELVELGAVELRVYTRRALHGKTYLLHHQDPNIPSAGFVGSSNLTGAGLNQNLELNLYTTEGTSTEELKDWFEELWSDRYTLRIDADILEVIDDSWASPQLRSPFDVYLKVCHTMSRDVRAGLAQYNVSELIAGKLLEHQTTAVKTLARRIMQRRGTMLGDVVGLGKTLTAIAVALMLRDNHGFQPLVICPKNLQSMWEEHLKAYDLPGRVVPYSMVHTVLPTLPRFRFVIVDESHTLRNEGTRTYNAVQKYLHENESHVLLLTATPYNLKYGDVANQLALFLDEDEDLGLTPEFALQRNPNLYENLEVAHSTLAAFRKSEEPEDWRRLMGEHLVRRTRSFVLNNYAKDDSEGRKYLEFKNSDGSVASRFTFPLRKAVPVNHAFDANDSAAKMADDRTLDGLASLKLPRYSLTDHLIPDAQYLASPEDKKFIEDFEASRGQVVGFVRTNFYKRLSSSGHSFILSLFRHLRRNELFDYALKNELPLPAGTIDPVTLSEDDIDFDELLADVSPRGLTFPTIPDDYARLAAESPRGIRWVSSSLFKDSLQQDLAADSRTIRDLLKWYGEWKVPDDSKLRALVDLANEKHPNEKILVFTEYKDTANYIAKGLRELGVEKVGVATGESEDATNLARRFSPKTNRLSDDQAPVAPADEIRVLIATDVLSEGQNLQQAHIIVNFDLPWAIIKLIQRAGRVDRIGQESDTVLLYTMVHGELEEQLNLRRRIQERLAANAATFGSDEKFFGTATETQAISDLYDGRIEDISTAEDVDASSYAYEIWEAATKDDPKLRRRIERMPDLVDTTRPAQPGDREGILCCATTDSGIDSFAWQNAQGESSLLTGQEALAILKCTPETAALPLREGHDEAVRELITGVIAKNLDTSGRLRGERRILWNRLGQTLEAHSDPSYAEALDALYKSPLTTVAINSLRTARRRQGTTNLDLLELIANLNEQGILTTTTNKSADAIRIVASMGVSNV
ncbi:helicase-related protein [Corynebacterium sp. YSMAA1_1_D6]|uniref:helicase-related protein n=1 Tax=Corynebacterium sp. YSMAA1_1_D6 TaxID=3383589 RepID=UPI0038D0099E